MQQYYDWLWKSQLVMAIRFPTLPRRRASTWLHRRRQTNTRTFSLSARERRHDFGNRRPPQMKIQLLGVLQVSKLRKACKWRGIEGRFV